MQHGESENTWVLGDRDTEHKEMIKKRQGEKEREKEEEEKERESGCGAECEVLKAGF